MNARTHSPHACGTSTLALSAVALMARSGPPIDTTQHAATRGTYDEKIDGPSNLLTRDGTLADMSGFDLTHLTHVNIAAINATDAVVTMTGLMLADGAVLTGLDDHDLGHDIGDTGCLYREDPARRVLGNGFDGDQVQFGHHHRDINYTVGGNAMARQHGPEEGLIDRATSGLRRGFTDMAGLVKVAFTSTGNFALAA